MLNLSFDAYEEWCFITQPAGQIWKRQPGTIWLKQGENISQEMLFQHHYRTWLDDPDLAAVKIASSLIRYFELAKDPVDVLGEDYFA